MISGMTSGTDCVVDHVRRLAFISNVNGTIRPFSTKKKSQVVTSCNGTGTFLIFMIFMRVPIQFFFWPLASLGRWLDIARNAGLWLT